MCARIAVEGAKCNIYLAETPKDEHVVLFFCGHWVHRICFHQWCVSGAEMQFTNKRKKGKQGYRSSDLMSIYQSVREYLNHCPPIYMDYSTIRINQGAEYESAVDELLKDPETTFRLGNFYIYSRPSSQARFLFYSDHHPRGAQIFANLRHGSILSSYATDILCCARLEWGALRSRLE